MIVAFIDAYKHLFGVEPICRVLKDHDLPIAPSTYYAAKNRQASARQQSDERLLEVVLRVHRENFGVYGVRKVWHALQHEGLAVGRDRVARLMRLAGLKGMTRRRKVRTTVPVLDVVRSPDLVRLNRTFKYDFCFRESHDTLDELTDITRRFREWYNQQRPHSTLGYQTPWARLLAVGIIP